MQAYELKQQDEGNEDPIRALLNDINRIPEDLRHLAKRIQKNTHLFNFFEYILHASKEQRDEALEHYGKLAPYMTLYFMTLDIIHLAEALEPKPTSLVLVPHPLSPTIPHETIASVAKIITVENQIENIRKRIEELEGVLKFLEQGKVWIGEIPIIFQVYGYPPAEIKKVRRDNIGALAIAEDINSDKELRNRIILKIRGQVSILQNLLPKNNKQLPPASGF